MYKAIALLFLLFPCGVCFSQIDRQHNAPRVGDNVDYFRVSYLSVSVKDNSVVWDLSQSTLGRKKYTSSYILNGAFVRILIFIRNVVIISCITKQSRS